MTQPNSTAVYFPSVLLSNYQPGCWEVRGERLTILLFVLCSAVAFFVFNKAVFASVPYAKAAEQKNPVISQLSPLRL